MNIVLAHGFLGFRSVAGVEYFAGIAEFFRTSGHNVLVTQVDPASGISTRGEELRTQILQAFSNGALDPADKAHIIAHSMGGLDARYVLSPANPNTTAANDVVPRVASLTTVSTPHRGSPIADLLAAAQHTSDIFSHLPLELSIFRPQHIEDKLRDAGISIDGLIDLTSEHTKIFNQQFHDNPAVRYRSVAGKGRNSPFKTCAALLLCYEYMKTILGEENDGLVPVSSAMWGEFDSNEWPNDHADEIGHDLDRPADRVTPECLARYSQLIARLGAAHAA